MRGRTHQRDVGIWLDKEDELLVSGADSHAETTHHSGQQGSQRRAVLLPPRQSQEALVDIYLRRIHPTLPLIDEQEFQRQFKEGSASPYLVQAICLAASKDHEAEPFLRLANSGKLALSEFSNLLYDELNQANSLKLERRRVTLIQILALLSLHVPGPRSFEDASLYLTQAIHHAHTMGLHLTSPGPVQDKKPAIALFWCLWALDRYNAAIQGRPLVIHDRDLGQQLADILPLFEAPFRVLLSLASALADVFVVYRPALEGPIDSNKPEIPRFEDVVDKCEAWDVPLDTILSLELVYHAIALLASRPWVLKDQPKSDTLYLRQDLSVYRIVSLIQIHEVSQLLPLPIIPYAISLSFSVAYKQIQRCQLLSTQDTAKHHVRALYKSLEALSPTWWSAQVMTRLGRRVLHEIQRTTDRTNDQILPEQPRRRRPSDPTIAEYISTPALSSDLTASENVDSPLNGTGPRSQLPVDFADIGHDTFGYPSGNAAFDDIDDLLGNFLNINVPTCPTHPSFTDFDVAWDDQMSNYASFY
ncbi:hypothetical protein P170DRAFT_370456 [Aspergillus steynii IBT 23096]|uniref:Xylanolytic transcriptional activator regulatory domain-containing protein n=1 Tax=Aspergillus steynii IBT 23096 TaxID=1392250 RepID=A0A2I2FRY9_9EURO|nr:uncharacterized protein P170DRAFT_370456 [Aspergillus steynii IBT 23096]PLB43400.1 hypothetical protein P170DRAFT_370456 [Aspergillus steynii IBT 23096]